MRSRTYRADGWRCAAYAAADDRRHAGGHDVLPDVQHGGLDLPGERHELEQGRQHRQRAPPARLPGADRGGRPDLDRGDLERWARDIDAVAEPDLHERVAAA